MKTTIKLPLRKKAVRLLVLLLILSLSLTGCGILPKEEELPTAPILTEGQVDEYVLTPVFRSDIEVGSNIRCTYIPSEEERLSFSVGGETISHVYVSMGDHVMPGDLLMELDVSSFDDQIREQQNDLDNISLELYHLSSSWSLELEAAKLEDSWNAAHGTATDRESSVNSQFGARQSLLYSEYEVASLRLEELEKQKAKRQIYASIEGNVTSLYGFEDGERSVKNRTVVVITNMEAALFEVYSGNRDLIRTGEEYMLVCNEKTYPVIARAASELDVANVKEGRMYFQMEMPDPELSQGDTGIVRITTSEKHNVLCVVTSAIQDLGGQTVVYIIDDEGLRQVQPVKVGISNDKLTEILEGLSEGDSVILK